MKQKVLLTGFDPFGGERVNPSWEAVKQLHGEVIDDVILVAEQIPTVFGKSVVVLEQLIQEHDPDIVICVGQAGGRQHITPERVAINMNDARIPDNQGNQPIDEPIVDKGPVAYWSTIPIKRMVENMKESNIPASVSHTAGTFVCNHIFYGLMDYITRTKTDIRGLSLETIVKGIKIAAVTAAKYESDIHTVGGTTH